MQEVPPTLKTEAQEVLDELWSEKLIPFALNVGKLTTDDDQYTIHFYDARLRTAHVPMTGEDSFKERVRTAVLACVAKLSGL